jgi:hypothetical protein
VRKKGDKKKSGKKNTTEQKLVLLTAILGLLKELIVLIRQLTG